MPPTNPDHTAVVDTWLRSRQGESPARRVDRFAAGFNAVWARAKHTLGAATLEAIGDRVMLTAAARYPQLAGVRIGDDGLRRDVLAPLTADGADPTEALAFTLAELLRIVGRLTAEILTPALHAELATSAQGEDGQP